MRRVLNNRDSNRFAAVLFPAKFDRQNFVQIVRFVNQGFIFFADQPVSNDPENKCDVFFWRSADYWSHDCWVCLPLVILHSLEVDPTFKSPCPNCSISTIIRIFSSAMIRSFNLRNAPRHFRTSIGNSSIPFADIKLSDDPVHLPNVAHVAGDIYRPRPRGVERSKAGGLKSVKPEQNTRAV